MPLEERFAFDAFPVRTVSQTLYIQVLQVPKVVLFPSVLIILIVVSIFFSMIPISPILVVVVVSIFFSIIPELRISLHIQPSAWFAVLMWAFVDAINILCISCGIYSSLNRHP